MAIVQNLVIIQGRMAGEPDFIHTQDGTAGVQFFVAVERLTANAKRVVDSFHVSAFGERAEKVHKLCHKGTDLLVRGQLRPLAYSAGADILADKIEVDYKTPESGNAYQREPEKKDKIDMAED